MTQIVQDEKCTRNPRGKMSSMTNTRLHAFGMFQMEYAFKVK